MPSCCASVYPSRFVFSFLARHVGRDWTVCYWGLAVSRPALMPKYCSSQTSRSSFNRHAKILEREREDRSLWLYLYGIRVTDIGGKLKSLCDPVYVEFFWFVLHFLALSAWRLPWVSWSWPTDISKKLHFLGIPYWWSRVHTWQIDRFWLTIDALSFMLPLKKIRNLIFPFGFVCITSKLSRLFKITKKKLFTMFLFLAECNSLFLVAHNREIVLFFFNVEFQKLIGYCAAWGVSYLNKNNQLKKLSIFLFPSDHNRRSATSWLRKTLFFVGSG